MIQKIGIDIIENERFENFLDDDRKLKRILSADEVLVYKTFVSKIRQLEYMATRFAAKEALFKAGVKDAFNKISILNHEDGSPYVQCSCEDRILISLSHDRNSSIAFIIIEKN
jgi:holo-[acyl-carrier protein] synthase